MTINVYGLVALAAVICTRYSQFQASQMAPKPRQTMTLMFDHLTSTERFSPEVSSTEGKPSVAAAPDGTGTIDPSMLAQDALSPLESSLREIQDLSIAPIQPVAAVGDKHLPLAIGGSGFQFGSDHGNGGGSSRGSGIGRFRRAPGLDPELDLKDLEVIHEEIPDYPKLAVEANIEGDVVLRVTINEMGVPIRAEVVDGPPALLDETMRAIKLWRFGRGLFRGRKVDATFDITFRYSLLRR